jgi:hypothetical protein
MSPTREAMTGLASHIGLGDGEAEPLLQALLHHHSGVALERVDDGRVLADVVDRKAGQVDAPPDLVGKPAPVRNHVGERKAQRDRIKAECHVCKRVLY